MRRLRRLGPLVLLALLAVSLDPGSSAIPDFDGDLVPDYCDNCRGRANRDQADSDRNGVGDACICGDVDGNGFTNVVDALAIARGEVAQGHANFDRCDVSGDRFCNVVDALRIARGEVLSSAEAQLCPAFLGDLLPGALPEPASPVDGSCNPDEDPACDDPFRQGACFETRVSRFPEGPERPWRIHAGSDGCTIDPQVLIDAGFPAAATNPNNPTDAFLADQSLGAVRCPDAAFATFAAGVVCDETRPCDPRDRGKICGQDNRRGGTVDCGNVDSPRACELLDGCRGQCGYRDFDCAAQYRRNLRATCLALPGQQRAACQSTCLAFAELYADLVDDAPDPGAGVFTASDLERQLALCKCCPDLGPNGEPPAICGDGVCEHRTESCHPSSCPEDCGPCPVGTPCLTDGDCAIGACSHEGRCEPLPAGASCAGDTACRSGSCVSGTCEAVCGDRLCDGEESCGVSDPGSCAADCGLCGNGDACGEDSDCVSGICSANACTGLTALSPCLMSDACESGVCNLGACNDSLLAEGEACGLDSACQGGICDLGRCAGAPKAPGTACERSEACETRIVVDPDLPPVGLCNAGLCLGEPLPVGSACDRDEACEPPAGPCPLLGPCVGTCNLGECVEGPLPFGSPCDNDKVCQNGFCAAGTCRKAALEPCETGSECASGVCSSVLGDRICAAICGDGFCDLRGAEVCGSDDLLTCRSDCGTCPAFGDVLCLANSHCTSGICNFGLCLAGKNGPGTLCTTDAACWSGICNFGVCVSTTTPVGSPCTTNQICESGACNFGLCVQSRSLENDHPCTTGEACVGGVCNFGFCTDPLPLDAVCSADESCQSGVCNLGLCFPPGALGTTAPCTTDGACESGFCAPLPIPPIYPGTCRERCGDGVCNGLEICGFSNLIATCVQDCDLCPSGRPCLSHFDCASGICNFGFCSDGNLGTGAVCSANSACASGVCNFGLCIDAKLPAGLPCTTDAACRSGACVGVCASRCGDAFCDGLEKCGDSDSGLECKRDCGRCASGSICLDDADCLSGRCLAGLCVPVCGDGTCEPPVELCGAVDSGLECASDCGRCPDGTVCLTDAVCASGACNFGFCVGFHSLPPGGACTTPNACSNAICELACCGRPLTAACTANSECCSNICVNDILGNRSCGLCLANDDCPSGVCNFGTCIEGNLPPGSLCSTGAACRSGSCVAGVCVSRCGDGFCDGLELCGAVDSGLECTSDCGKCGNGTACLSNAVCASGVCNVGFCVAPSSVPAGLPCTTSLACRSGSCVAGFCQRVCGDGFCDGGELCGAVNSGLECNRDCGKCPNGTLCLSNAVCASNACNFGVCVGFHSVPVGGACTTANACSNGICQLGCCGKPFTASCSRNSDCCSNKCVTDIFGNRSCGL
jgi:hypothetical protein